MVAAEGPVVATSTPPNNTVVLAMKVSRGYPGIGTALRKLMGNNQARIRPDQFVDHAQRSRR